MNNDFSTNGITTSGNVQQPAQSDTPDNNVYRLRHVSRVRPMINPNPVGTHNSDRAASPVAGRVIRIEDLPQQNRQAKEVFEEEYVLMVRQLSGSGMPNINRVSQVLFQDGFITPETYSCVISVTGFTPLKLADIVLEDMKNYLNSPPVNWDPMTVAKGITHCSECGSIPARDILSRFLDLRQMSEFGYQTQQNTRHTLPERRARTSLRQSPYSLHTLATGTSSYTQTTQASSNFYDSMKSHFSDLSGALSGSPLSDFLVQVTQRLHENKFICRGALENIQYPTALGPAQKASMLTSELLQKAKYQTSEDNLSLLEVLNQAAIDYGNERLKAVVDQVRRDWNE